MVLPLVLAAIGAAAGYARTKEEQKQANEARKLNSVIARYSPWTHMQADTNIKDPSMTGNITSGALGGAAFGAQDLFKGKEGPASVAEPTVQPSEGGQTAMAQVQPQRSAPGQSSAVAPTGAYLSGSQNTADYLGQGIPNEDYVSAKPHKRKSGWLGQPKTAIATED